MKSRPHLLLTLLLILAMCGTALSQRISGTLRGTVTDPTGAVVAGATVTATSEQTGIARSTTSTSAGTYVFDDLTPGVYTVSVATPNFQKVDRTHIDVLPNQTVTADAKLRLAGESTTVEVQSGSEVVQTTSSELSNDFGARAVSDLPNPGLGGTPLNLALLAPNTTSQGAGVLGEGGSIGGARPRMNSFTIDGVDDNRVDVTGHTSQVIPEAVQDFQLITNMFTAEQGHSAGGQFNLITRSGTNNWHGAGWEYNNNRDFNAMDNLEKSATDDLTTCDGTCPRRVDRNRAGAMIGGPIIKNKLFVFGAYQFSNIGLAASAVQQLAPTAAGLTQLETMTTSAPVKNILAQFPVASAQTKTDTVNGVAIPIGTIQPAAPSFQNDHTFNISTDLNLTKHQLRGRFLYDRSRSPNVNPDTPLSQFTGDFAADNRKVILTDAWSLTNNIINDFRIGYSRFVQNFTVPAQFANFPNAEIDTFGLNIGPEGNSPQSYVQNNYQLLDNITLVKGKHTIKFGPEFRRWIAPSNFLPRSRGEWDYANLQEFINDQVPTGFNGALRGAGSGNFNGNQWAIYGFAEDDWKVTPRLTLNLGLRYEWTGNPADVKLQNLNAVADQPGVPFLPAISNLPTQIVFRTPKSDKNNFMPRIGFAFDPFGDGNTSVRGGFGISYDVTPQNFPLLSLPPQLQTEQNPDITCALPGAPAFCTNPSAGFLASGGLLQVNVPPVTAQQARDATIGIMLDTVQPKILTWTLSVQREIAKDTSVELRYLGTRATQLPVQARLNTISAFDAGIQPLPTFFSASQVPGTISGGSRLSDFQNFDPARAPGFSDASLLTGFPAIGGSIYHSGAVDVNRRMAKGLMIRGNYTWSHNIDDSTNELFSSRVNPRRAFDWANLRLDRGNSVLDVRHKLALSWIYDIPMFHSDSGLLKGLLGGWQYTGNYLAQSGQPVTILGGADANANGDSAGDPAVLNSAGIEGVGTKVSSAVCVGAGGVTSVVPLGSCAAANTAGYVADNSNAKYAQALLGTLSTVGRNTFRSPGVNVWNMGTIKSFKFTERFDTQFRVNVQNIFNHRNFSLAQPTVLQTGVIIGTVNNALSTTYANVTSPFFLDPKQFTGGSRLMELGVKLVW